jgi:hypothetical protein
MLETIAIILIILWLFGMVAGVDFGGIIWVLLIVAAILFLVRFTMGRKTL